MSCPWGFCFRTGYWKTLVFWNCRVTGRPMKWSFRKIPNLSLLAWIHSWLIDDHCQSDQKKIYICPFLILLADLVMWLFSYLKIIKQIGQQGRDCFVKEAFIHCRVPVSVWSGCEYDICRVPLSVWGRWELNHCGVLASAWDGCDIAISRNNGWIKQQELNLLPWPWVLTGLCTALLEAFLSVFCVATSKCRLQGFLWHLSWVPFLGLHPAAFSRASNKTLSCFCSSDTETFALCICSDHQPSRVFAEPSPQPQACLCTPPDYPPTRSSHLLSTTVSLPSYSWVCLLLSALIFSSFPRLMHLFQDPQNPAYLLLCLHYCMWAQARVNTQPLNSVPSMLT